MITGAGKIESMKMFMRYLAYMATRSVAKERQTVDQRVWEVSIETSLVPFIDLKAFIYLTIAMFHFDSLGNWNYQFNYKIDLVKISFKTQKGAY